jgi:hypothetical protein
MTATTPAQIKALYNARTAQMEAAFFANVPGAPNPGSRCFFDVMERLHGDTVRAMGTCEIDGQIYLYAKADTPARRWARRFALFLRTRDRGRAYFNAWRFDPETVDLIDLDHEAAQRIWDAVYRRGGQIRMIW